MHPDHESVRDKINKQDRTRRKKVAYKRALLKDLKKVIRTQTHDDYTIILIAKAIVLLLEDT